MARYYSRLAGTGLNIRHDREFKIWFLPLLTALAFIMTAAAALSGISMIVVMLPAILFMVMFVGAINPTRLTSIICIYASFTPMWVVIKLSKDPILAVIMTLCMLFTVMLCIPYRPFLWKNDAASTPIAVFILFLNLAVTSTNYTVTLVVKILIESAVTWVLCMGAIQVARKLLQNGRFLQWVLKQD